MKKTACKTPLRGTHLRAFAFLLRGGRRKRGVIGGIIECAGCAADADAAGNDSGGGVRSHAFTLRFGHGQRNVFERNVPARVFESSLSGFFDPAGGFSLREPQLRT